MQDTVHTKKPTGNGLRTNGTGWAPVLIAIIGAVIGSGGSIALVFGTPLGQSIARPDPFTGTQASALEYRLNSIEVRMSTHLGNHPDAINQFDRRITTLEVMMEQIIKNQERIIRNQEK